MIACQRDARLLRATFEVLRVEPAGDVWHAWLDDTVLYPEGGGQPADHGTLGGVRVLDVRPGLLHVLEAPVALGPAEVVVDAARRFDHMQQHTGQHLLTAVAQDRFGWATTSFHLHEGELARCDVELDAPGIDLEALSASVNAEIRAARPVRVREVGPGDLDALGVRTRGLPEGHEGPVRLVEIDGLDVNTCGGTHCASTAELQAVQLLGAEAIRGGTRLHFVVGGRVMARLRAAEAALARAGSIVSRGLFDVPDGVAQLFEQARAAGKALAATQAELADALGAELARQPGPVRVLHRDEGDAAFLNRVATAALRDAPGAVLLLTAGQAEGAFLAAGPPARLEAVREALLSALEARGGGKPGRLQGKAARLAGRDAAAAILRGA